MTLKESFQLDMNTMIEEAKDRGVRPEDLFSSYNFLVDPAEFFEQITAGTQDDYKKFPFLRIEKNSKYNEFYKVLLAYLDSEGTGDKNYKKLDPAEVRRDGLGEWHPSDGRHRAAFCMLLGIKLPVKRVFEIKESLQLLEGDHTQQAVDAFGTTYYKSRAGYMLRDGRLLDLTYGGNPREDHRAIQDAFDDMDLDSGSDYLIEFMNEGNIRCIPELPGIDLAVEPTDKQYTALKDYISYWVGHDRHFEVQFSDRSGNQVDWKEYNGFVSTAEILLDIKDHFSSDLNESWESDYSISDLIGTDTLYHATYKPYWEQIKKDGAIKPKAHSNWDISDNYIYLSRGYDNALSYAVEAENVPEDYLDQIVVLEIDANKLDINLLNIDHNQAYGNYDEVDIEDPQTWIELQYEGSIPVHCIKRIHNESIAEQLNEVYPQKGETKSDFINRFMRATAREYPDVKQRYAVAQSYWNRRNLNEAIQDDVFNINKTGVSKYDEWLHSQSARDRDNVNLEFKYMTPREYFEACGQLFGNSFDSQVRQIENDKNINKELDKVYDSNEKMNLTLLDYVSDPPTQEGRHRMYVLAQKYGWDENKYPVAVFTIVDPKRAEREKEERRQEKLYKYIDKAVMRALDFTYRNYEELKEQLEYYLEDYIETPEVKISERGSVLVIIVNGLEYEINKNEFDWDEEKPEPDFSFDDDLGWEDIELNDIIK